MIMVMNASGSWNPRALARIRPIDALLDSAMPLVNRYSMVASIDTRYRRIIRASFTNGASFDRDA